MAHDEPWETCNIFVHNHIHIQKFETRCEWLNYKLDTLIILTTFFFELGSKTPCGSLLGHSSPTEMYID